MLNLAILNYKACYINTTYSFNYYYVSTYLYRATITIIIVMIISIVTIIINNIVISTSKILYTCTPHYYLHVLRMPAISGSHSNILKLALQLIALMFTTLNIGEINCIRNYGYT